VGDARAGDTVRSRFAVHVQPHRYTVPELVDILEPRAEQGLVGGIVSQRQLETLADGAVGVARRGIQALRAAAELAGERGHTTVTDQDIADSFARPAKRIRESNLQSLTTHHQVLYALVRDAGVIKASALNKRYDRLNDQLYQGRPVSPITKRDRRNKLTKLIEYDLIDASDDRNTRYEVVDEQLASPLDIDAVYAK